MPLPLLGTDCGDGDATKHLTALFSEKRVFSEKGGGNSVNERFGEDLFTGKAIQ